MTPEVQELRDSLRASYPGCVDIDTDEGLIVVRRPTSAEFIEIEDAVISLVDLGAKLSPYAGLDAIKRVVVHPTPDRVEALLNEYPRFFDQLVTLARRAAQGGSAGVSVRKVDLKDEELYTREAATDEGRRTKRSGGRIFAVECFTLRSAPGELRPELIITGRHILRRLGLIEDRELKKEITATGYTDEHGNKQPRNATLAKVARAHVLDNVPGCTVPDWEAHPHLLTLLGQAVITMSSIGIGSSSGK